MKTTLKKLNALHLLRFPMRFIIGGILLCSSLPSFATAYSDSVIAQYGFAIDSLIYNGHGEEFNKLVDYDAFLDKIIIEKEDNVKLKQFNAIFKMSFKLNFDLGQQLVESTSYGGIYTFLTYYEDEDLYYLVFSLFSDGGLNYHVLEVNYGNGKPKIEDVYIVVTDENLSETIGALYFNALFEKGYVDYRDGSATGSMDDLKHCLEAKELIKTEKYQEAYDELQKTSESYRTNKVYENLLLSAAEGISDELHAEVLDQIIDENAGLGHKYLMNIDKYFLEENYKAGLANLDSLDELVGIDPIIDYYRGALYMGLEQWGTAKIHFKKVQDTYGFSSAGYIGVLTVLLESQKHAEATEQLKLMVDIFAYNQMETLDLVVDYPDYVQSPEGKAFFETAFVTTEE